MKDFLKDYLSFTAKERAGIITILILIVAGAIFPFIYHKIAAPLPLRADIFDQVTKEDSSSNKDSVFLANNEKFKHGGNYKFLSDHNTPQAEAKHHYFNFDPNNASSADWERLGVQLRTTQTIKKYLSKGGHFYKPEDLLKIYGLPHQQAMMLIPYVKIPATAQNTYVKPIAKSFIPYKKADALSININTADTATLQRIPGIGPAYSNRIIRFRNRLGGFYNVDQVGETYGLPDSTFKKMKDKIFLTPGGIKKINLNTADLEQLKSHPYIRYKLANLIVEYRNQHGAFHAVSELKNILTITDDMYQKLEPYLSVQ